MHNILLFSSVLMKSWLIPKVLEDGAYSFFIPRSWAVVGLNNLLSVKTHRRVATGNMKSQEVAGALASTAPSSTARNPGTRRGFI